MIRACASLLIFCLIDLFISVSGVLKSPTIIVLLLISSFMLLLLLSRFSHLRLCATSWTAAHQAPPSMGFSRQESWSGVPLPSPTWDASKDADS